MTRPAILAATVKARLASETKAELVAEATRQHRLTSDLVRLYIIEGLERARQARGEAGRGR